MSIQNAIASLAVNNLNVAAAWYGSIFQRRADSNPMPEVMEWKFERGGWLQIYQLPERAGHGSCTLAVTDLESVIGRLQSLGIDTSERTSAQKSKPS